MNTSDTDYEDAWVDAWTDLNFLIDEHRITTLLLPDKQEIALVDAKKWIQDTARVGDKISFSVEFFNHKDSILMNR